MALSVSGLGGGGAVMEACKGYIHVFGANGQDEGNSRGFYAISPAVPEADGSRALIMGVPLGFQEIVQPTVTLDDKRVLYLFGSAWNDLTVSGILLLGTESTRGAQLTSLLNWYEANRVSKKRGPISVSLGTSGVDAYVVGLRLDQANPTVNTQTFSIMAMTPNAKTKSSL